MESTYRNQITHPYSRDPGNWRGAWVVIINSPTWCGVLLKEKRDDIFGDRQSEAEAKGRRASFNHGSPSMRSVGERG